MASPFYTPIRVNQSDFSPITQGAAAYGQYVGAGIEKIGDAVGKVASSYFEKKGFEKSAADWFLTPQGKRYAKQRNLDINNPEEAIKYVAGAINEAGGYKEFKDQVQSELQAERMREQHNQMKELNALKTEETELALNALKRKNEDEEQNRLLFAQAFKKDEETGEVKFDIDNIKTTEKNRHLLPVVYDQFKKMGLLGSFNYSKWKNNLIKNNAWDPSDRQGMSAMFDATAAAYPDISGEDMRRFKQNLSDDTYEPNEIMDSANKWWNQNPNAKTWMEAEETNSKINTGLNNALAKGPDGQYIVKNASTAGFVIRQFARLANGVGVMTNEDVDAVKGASDAQSAWDRLKTKYLGDKVETRQATEEDVRNGFADRVGETINIRLGARATAQDLLMIKDATEAFMQVNQRRLQQHGVQLQEYLTNAYTGVPEERLLALSPFSEYWHDAHRFTMSPKDLGKLNRTLAIEGEEAVVRALQEANPNLRPSQISQFINMARDYSPPSNEVSESQEPKQPTMGTDFDPPQEKIDNSSRPDMSTTDGITTDDVINASIGAAGGKALGNWMMNNLARGNTLEAMGEPSSRYKEAIKAFRNAPMSDVKEFAKDMGVDPASVKRKFGKDADLRLRETLEKKFKAQVRGKVGERLAKKGIAKKVISKVLSIAFTGGLATAAGAGSVAFDIIDIFDTKHEVAREELNKMLGQYKEGSRERKLIQDVLNDMNYKSSDFQKFKRDNPQLQQMGGDRNIYNYYRLINEGT